MATPIPIINTASVAQRLEMLAVQFTGTLFHWDQHDYNQQWITAAASEAEFLTHMNLVASKVGTQAQGKGLYLTPKPSSYTAKHKGTEELMVVTISNAPFIDATKNPTSGTALYALAPTTNDILKAVDHLGNPPKLLIKFGNYYRLSTVTGITLSTDLKTVLASLPAWKTELWQQADKNAYHALKKQAVDNRVPGADTW
jgi:hypothetical protein